MTPLVSVIVVLALALLVVGAVRLIARWQKPPHPPIDLDGLGHRPGVIVFTSTDCKTCSKAMLVVGEADSAVREVTWELEPHLFDRYNVEAVPLIAVLDAAGRSVYFGTGVPNGARFRSAIRKAGIR
jgi:hypothetical protein